MLFTTKLLTEWFSNYHGSLHDEKPINKVTTDSREKSANTLFIPLIGDTFDGHDFLESAIKNGAVATFWQKDKDIPASLPKEFLVFFVDNTLEALQQLAEKYRDKINPTVIGVTGSNGKTTTKDLIGEVLQSQFKTHRTQGNYNNHIGMPLSILSMNPETEVLVLEMGMNNFGEIERLSRIAKPDFAVITNIGESHIENLGSRQGIAKAKLEIVAGLKQDGYLIIDGDEPLLSNLNENSKVIKVGFNESNDVLVEDVTMSEKEMAFSLDGKQYKINLLGKHNVKNALFAITIAKILQVPYKKIAESLLHLNLTGMRFELIKGKNGVTIINDAYNASPTSMKASIGVVETMENYSRKVLVLGDMFEMGKQSKSLHKQVAESITGKIDAVLTVGNDSSEITKEIVRRKEKTYAKHFQTKDTLMKELLHYLDDQTVILLKASRGMKLESLLPELV